MSRFHELLRNITPATLGVVSLCLFLFLVQVSTNHPPLRAVTLCPRLVVFEGEVYRILTSALFHASLMHIGMNLMSTLAIGGMLEKRLGTLRVCYTMLLSIVMTSLLVIAAALFLDLVLERKGLMNQHSIGFSGVIFHLSVLECNLGSHESSRSVFGLLEVPSYLYPWVL
jgi:membrane associated rhomboid family serine protease